MTRLVFFDGVGWVLCARSYQLTCSCASSRCPNCRRLPIRMRANMRFASTRAWRRFALSLAVRR